MIIKDKIPPHDIDAEDAVIGSILIGGDMNEITLEPADFYQERNQWIYQAYINLKDKSTSINEITVAHELHSNGKLDGIGGASFLAHLIASTPTPHDLKFYAEIVKKLSLKRKLITAGIKIQQVGYDESQDVYDSISKADDAILALRKNTGKVSVVTPDDRVKNLYERYEELYKKESGIAVSTGLSDLDNELCGGFIAPDLIVVGARTGMGKTTFLQNVANKVGEMKHVLFCSGEMGYKDISDRDIASRLGLTVSYVRSGGYSDETYDRIINEGIHSLGKINVSYYEASRDNPFTVPCIYQAALQTQIRSGLDLIVIDYLGRLGDQYGSNSNERLGYITNHLKDMAMELNIPIIIAHQLNRATEMRDDKHPQLHDLRDSGNIEQDADIVLFLYRDSYYGQASDGVTEILIAKFRQGEAGKMVKVYFDKEHQLYRNLSKREIETY